MLHRNFKLLLTTLVLFMFNGILFASSSGFQIAPPPIAYPYFEEGKVDTKLEAMFISIESEEAKLSLSGVGFNYIGRKSISDILAFDIQGSISALSGEMPGVPPLYFSSSFYARPDGNSEVSMTALTLSFNIEFQLIKEDEGSLIFFFGPSLGVTNMTLSTPYSMVRYSDGQVTPGYNDSMSIVSNTVGSQFGMQANLPLDQGVSISPFFMVNTISGTSTITDNPNTSDTEPMSFTADTPATTMTSFGMDIIIKEISIGTILQNISQDQESDVNIVMFRFGYNY